MEDLVIEDYLVKLLGWFWDYKSVMTKMIDHIFQKAYLILFIVLIIAIAQPVNASDVLQAAGTQSPTKTVGTPSSTYTPTATPSPTSTTTLMPLPVITLIFPVTTSTPTTTISPQLVQGTVPSEPSTNGQNAPISPRIRVLGIVLVILWLILAGFIIIYIRQIM